MQRFQGRQSNRTLLPSSNKLTPSLSLPFAALELGNTRVGGSRARRGRGDGNRMDHAVKATRGRPLNTLRFENDELECLYQRYTLKLQRFSVLGVVALVVVLCGVMAALSFAFNNAATFHVSIDGSSRLPLAACALCLYEHV